MNSTHAESPAPLARGLALLTVDPEEMRAFYTSLIDSPAIVATGPSEIFLPINDRADQRVSWIARFAVPDLDRSIAAATAHGGIVDSIAECPHAYLVTAPDGSRIVLESATAFGPAFVPSTSEMMELWTQRIDETCAFYAAILDARILDVPDDPYGYRVFVRAGETIASCLNTSGVLSSAAEPCWVPHFRVPDLNRAVTLAVDFGARVTVPPNMSVFEARFAVLADPSGAIFGLRERAEGSIYGSLNLDTGRFNRATNASFPYQFLEPAAADGLI